MLPSPYPHVHTDALFSQNEPILDTVSTSGALTVSHEFEFHIPQHRGGQLSESSAPPVPKVETLDPFEFDVQAFKDDTAEYSLDVKLPPDPFEPIQSDNFMLAILGQDQTVSQFDIRLDNDLYTVANKESSNIFPVSLKLKLSYSCRTQIRRSSPLQFLRKMYRRICGEGI
jgi:hypothetical protein